MPCMGHQRTDWGPFVSRLFHCWIFSEVCGTKNRIFRMTVLGNICCFFVSCCPSDLQIPQSLRIALFRDCFFLLDSQLCSSKLYLCAQHKVTHVMIIGVAFRRR